MLLVESEAAAAEEAAAAAFMRLEMLNECAKPLSGLAAAAEYMR